MVALIAHPGDRVAAAVAGALARRVDGSEIVVLDADELATTARWRHSLTEAGASAVVGLAGGRRFDSAEVRAVFNRFHHVQPGFFPRPADRSYAVMEVFALILSWLASLPCTVVNTASPRGLAGAERSLVEWLRLAALAGLPTRRLLLTSNGRRFARPGFDVHPTAAFPLELASTPLHPAVPSGRRPVVYAEPVRAERRVLVAGERAFGAPSEEWRRRCIELARLAGCALLEVHYASRADGENDWLVTGASAFPEELRREEAGAVAELLVSATQEGVR